jgi:hypothetical protein
MQQIYFNQIEKKIGIFVGGFILLFIIYYNLYDPASSTKNSHPKYQLNSSELVEEYKDNEANGDKKYKEQIISVTGYVTEISSDEINLNDVVCGFYGSSEQKKLSTLSKGQQLTVKGKCTGKWLWTVHLEDCVIESQGSSSSSNSSNSSSSIDNSSKNQKIGNRACEVCGKEFEQEVGWACRLDENCYTPTQSAPTQYLKYCSENCASSRGIELRNNRCE